MLYARLGSKAFRTTSLSMLLSRSTRRATVAISEYIKISQVSARYWLRYRKKYSRCASSLPGFFTNGCVCRSCIARECKLLSTIRRSGQCMLPNSGRTMFHRSKAESGRCSIGDPKASLPNRSAACKIESIFLFLSDCGY